MTICARRGLRLLSFLALAAESAIAQANQPVISGISHMCVYLRHDGPQMGLDGKWQANLYDPDGTRVELMEFQPVIKPCCSSFTADSPKTRNFFVSLRGYSI